MKITNQGNHLPVSRLTGRGPEKPRQLRSIVEQDDRLAASDVKRQDPEKFMHALAVGRIFHKTKGGGGTAFRIGAGNLLMTNAHVLSSGNPKDYRIEFTDATGHITRVEGDRLLAFSKSKAQTKQYGDFHTRQNLDFALFTINPSQFDQVKKFGHLELDANGAKAGEKIYIPQHGEVARKFPGGQVKRQYHKTIALTDDTKGQGQPSRIDRVYQSASSEDNLHKTVQYAADTNPGASGAPVISADSHKVIALHNSSEHNVINQATNMSLIVPEIKRFFTSTTPNTKPGKPTSSANQPDRNEKYQLGDRRYYKGTLQELWGNPSGGIKWVDVWRPKDYSIGALVVDNGNAYAYRGRDAQGNDQWAPVYDPAQSYRPNEQVYYYGRIVDADQLRSGSSRQHA